MAVKLRLARHGAKKRPYYRIVAADVRSPRDGRYIERIGSYNPLLAKDDPNRVIIDEELAKEWLRKGARPTERVARFLGAVGLWDWKHGDNPNKGKPGAKAVEMAEARVEKEAARKVREAEEKEAAAEAKKAAEEAAKAAEAEAKEAAKAAEAPGEDGGETPADTPAPEAASDDKTQGEAEAAKEGDPKAAGQATPAVD